MSRIKNISIALSLSATLALSSACVSQVDEPLPGAGAEATGAAEQALASGGQLSGSCLGDYCGYVNPDWFSCDSWSDGGRQWFDSHDDDWSSCAWGTCDDYEAWFGWYGQYAPYYYGCDNGWDGCDDAPDGYLDYDRDQYGRDQYGHDQYDDNDDCDDYDDNDAYDAYDDDDCGSYDCSGDQGRDYGRGYGGHDHGKEGKEGKKGKGGHRDNGHHAGKGGKGGHRGNSHHAGKNGRGGKGGH